MKKNEIKVGMLVWFKKHAFPIKIDGKYVNVCNKEFIVATIEVNGVRLCGVKKVISTGELSPEKCLANCKECKYKRY